MSELLPCPFCGGEANTLHRPHVLDWRYSVGCNDDECRGFIGLSWLYKTEAEAIAAWNSRTERTCKPIGTIRYDYEGGYAGFEYETELSCGHIWRDTYGDYPEYCPNCGRKVVDK